MIVTIVHGGQTGVDRGAWKGARDGLLNVTGWAPHHRRDELGYIPHDVISTMRVCKQTGFAARTKANAHDCDGLILVSPRRKATSPGTRYTQQCVECDPDKRAFSPWYRPHIIVESAHGIDAVAIGEFLAGLKSREAHRPTPRLMIAAPRASKWAAGEGIARDIVVEISCL